MKKTNITLMIALVITLFAHPIIAQKSIENASGNQENSLQEAHEHDSQEQTEQLEREKLLQEMDELKLFLKNHIEDIESTYRRNILQALRGIEISLTLTSIVFSLSFVSRTLRCYLCH